MRQGSQEIIEGAVEYIKYVNETNGYTVMEFACGDELLTVVGMFPNLHEGESLRLKGYFTNHIEYGEQFQAEDYEYITPVDGEALVKYLSSGVFEGLGPKTAMRIVERFGAETLRVLTESPEELAQVKGISLEKAERYCKAYRENFAYGQVMLYLQQFEIGNALASKIYKNYGEKTISIIEQNPYRMTEEVEGIGFRTADAMAQKMGMAQNSAGRIRAALRHILLVALQNGHVYLPKDVLFYEAERLLQIYEGDKPFEEALLQLAVNGMVRLDQDAVYLSQYYRYETGVASMLSDMVARPADVMITDFDKRIRLFQQQRGIMLAENQIQAVSQALANHVTIITGGPGTGKTTIIQCIIQIFKEEQHEVLIAAPTGRAAKRITEATGYEASTVHRMLELQYSLEEEESRFERNHDNPLDADVIVVDEASMLDLSLMYHLLDAMDTGTRLILCGDANQLPSVGAGTVLKDLIESGVIPTVKLTEIYRQATESLIVTNAHKIQAGQMPAVNIENGDFFFLSCENPNQIAETVVELCAERLPKKYGFHSFHDIQVLTAMRKGVCGVEQLNAKLQERLNPPSKLRAEKSLGRCIFREGDKVMQIKNNYSLRWEKSYDAHQEGEGLYNGDAGLVVHLNNALRYIDVEFDDNRVARYDMNQLEEIEHAFAVTIHKSQGSEFPAVVIPLVSGPQMLLTRNLIYTAITRARELVVLVGSKRVLQEMITNVMETKRYTGLKERLL